MLLGQQTQVNATATELQNQRRVPAHAINMGMQWLVGICQSAMQSYLPPGNIQQSTQQIFARKMEMKLIVMKCMNSCGELLLVKYI